MSKVKPFNRKLKSTSKGKSHHLKVKANYEGQSHHLTVVTYQRIATKSGH